jgi:hypothetical protein
MEAVIRRLCALGRVGRKADVAQHVGVQPGQRAAGGAASAGTPADRPVPVRR